MFRDFPTFSRTCIFFLLILLTLSLSLALPTSAFPFVHIVGSLASKLPSMINMDLDVYTFEQNLSAVAICLR